ncbi:GNAT family N-acetyltransferase [Gallalistipes aquisgranensis]|uniref:GNAT family N-acetyltransferase n=1 Tax=Gallalistipes aquisgranensis TaxID=2779358 RepID=UPI001CF8E80F|nr:GNAT family N-acetyltransferase [Gallalistipes aquisgranensis]MBE5033630.1 GNAT family N-acetyltransferase [Gallalistipes aquisgranensis]
MNALETDLIRLRAMEPEDIDILYLWENDTNVWKVSNTIAPFSKYILKQFIENQRYDIYETKQLRLIIESKELRKPVGAIDLFDLDPYNRRAGVGILIYDRRDKGQGFASAALSTLIRYGFQMLGLNQLYCNIPATNVRSLALFKSKGFNIIGLKKEWTKTTSDWQDEYMLQLLNPKKG